jgi:hypothetical protein
MRKLDRPSPGALPVGRRTALATLSLGWIALLGLVVAYGFGWVAAPATGAPLAADAKWDAPTARAARVFSVNDTGHLHFISESGSELVEEGPATGTLPGKVKVRFYLGATVRASFTIYPKTGGSISGHGSGALHSTGTYASFGGALAITHGSGRYARAHGSGGMYGAINRHTYALTVQTIGKLYY